MAVRAEAWARGRSSTEGREERVRSVMARAPSSPPVATRVVHGERVWVVRAVMLDWWIAVRVSRVSRVGAWMSGSRLVRAEEARMVMLGSWSAGMSDQVLMWPSVLAVQSCMSAPKRRWAACVRQWVA